MIPVNRSLTALAISLLLCLACQSTQPNSASFAAVTIQGRSPDQIRQVAGQVFQADGYTVASLGADEMIFQKEGSHTQSLAYNGIVGTQEGQLILIRVRASLVDLGTGAQRLQCKAFMVSNAGDSFFADETVIPHRKRGPYQKLLDQVAERLK